MRVEVGVAFVVGVVIVVVGGWSIHPHHTNKLDVCLFDGLYTAEVKHNSLKWQDRVSPSPGLNRSTVFSLIKTV